MKVIAVCSQKGGVGKSSVALNLGLALARRNWRTLIVDADPQGAIGLSLAQQRNRHTGFAWYLANNADLPSVLVRTNMPTLGLVPIGNLRISDTPAFDRYVEDGVAFKRLAEEAEEDWDLVIIDTPAGFGGASVGAMRASDHIISPLQAEPVAMRSTPQMLKMVAALREEGVETALLGFILTMFDPDNEVSVQVYKEAREQLTHEALFGTVIPRDKAFGEAGAAGVPVAMLSRRPPPIAAVFNNLAAEFEERAQLWGDVSGDGPISLID